MTPLRQGFHAALVLAGLAYATPTLAEPLAPMGPPTAQDAAALVAAEAPPPVPVAAPAPAAPASAAKSSQAPSWLAPRSAAKPVATGRSAVPSLGRLIGLALVLGALGAATLYYKRRGGKNVTKRVAPSNRLSVVSSTRIGPKAHAVVISVNGRQMLLGVTDASVKRLAFIDELEEDEREVEREPVRRAAPATRGAAIAVRNVTPEPARGGAFSDLLKTAFGKREPAPREADAASILAAETQDTVGGKAVAPNPGNVRMLDVEGQAQGLIRRLSGPRA